MISRSPSRAVHWMTPTLLEANRGPATDPPTVDPYAPSLARRNEGTKQGQVGTYYAPAG
jgi:hypothetical protein